MIEWSWIMNWKCPRKRSWPRRYPAYIWGAEEIFDSRSSSRDSSWVPPDYKSEALPFELTCSGMRRNIPKIPAGNRILVIHFVNQSVRIDGCRSLFFVKYLHSIELFLSNCILSLRICLRFDQFRVVDCHEKKKQKLFWKAIKITLYIYIYSWNYINKHVHETKIRNKLQGRCNQLFI
jgi:hypothetical protein